MPDAPRVKAVPRRCPTQGGRLAASFLVRGSLVRVSSRGSPSSEPGSYFRIADDEFTQYDSLHRNHPMCRSKCECESSG